MSERYLAIDERGRPHLAYGEDHLYYSWNDGTAWHREVVDSQARVGWGASLALDTLARPHIAYGGQGGIRYAFFDGTAWMTETLDTWEEGWTETSIVVDLAGKPGVAYFRDALRYAWYDGSRWYTETVGIRNPCWGISQALDLAGQPHITCGDGYGTIWHAWHDGYRWYTESLPLGGFSSPPTSLAIDTSSNLHLGYVGPREYPCYAYSDGTAWFTETVSISGSVHLFVAMALDPSNRPHMAYIVGPIGSSYALEYAWRGPGGWQHRTVEDGGSYASPALAVKEGGETAISYIAGRNLLLAHLHGQDWQTEEVDEMGFVGMFPALDVDSASRPHIVYRDGPDNELGVLKYAWYDGTAWHHEVVDWHNNPGLGENGLVLDAADQPHVVYCDGWAGQVHYAHRVGSIWRTEAISGVYGQPSLALDTASRPHVAAVGSEAVRYAYRDEGGWHIQEVDHQGWGRISLALDGRDLPHICYANNQFGLRHTWFDGAAWYSEDVDAGTIGATIDCSIALDNAGRPHISYHTSNQVRYAWYDGTRWYTQTVDISYSCVSIYTSLRLDADDRPSISYYAGNCYRGDVRYATLRGALWEIENVGSGGWFSYGTSLALDTAGWPHIAYYEADCADLRYAEKMPGQVWRSFLPLLPK